VNAIHQRSVRKLSVPKAHLASLSEERVAILAAFSFHLTEINVIWRAYNCCTHQLSGDMDTDLAIAVQKNTFLRIWSSKIFEFLEGLPKRTTDKQLEAFLSHVKAKLATPKALTGPKDSLASRFRHEATFHLNVEAIAKRLKYTSSQTCTDFYFDVAEANSYFPFGDETVFATSFNRYIESVAGNDRLETMKFWSDWIVSSSRELIYLFSDFLTDFIFDGQPTPDWTWTDLNLKEGMVAKQGKATIPLFFEIEVTP
jgi:hypothetical protein